MAGTVWRVADQGRRLRATRADPPGRARGDESRRALYSAALAQHEEMMTAARVVGPLGRPLPLYYAVHQAGKALAVAWADTDVSISGHGLVQVREKVPGDVCRFRVKHGRSSPSSVAVFDAAGMVLGAEPLRGAVEIGAAWAALPEAEAPPGGDWPLALPVWPEVYDAGARTFTGPAFRGFVHLRGFAGCDDAAAITALLRKYPDAAGAAVEVPYGGLARRATPVGEGVAVVWPRPDAQARYGEPVPDEVLAAHVTNRVPRYARTGGHWLIPVVGGESVRLPPLMLWWVLLFGLSALARYEPVAWQAALDLDRSPAADPLMELLDMALEIVPDLLYEAVVNGR